MTRADLEAERAASRARRQKRKEARRAAFKDRPSIWDGMDLRRGYRADVQASDEDYRPPVVET